jgi:hypothetical protein
MQHALYAPGLGYYVAGSTKFGAGGDFVTAPEVSPVFGRVLARQCAEVLADVADGAILEYGAGSGKLARDILETLARLDALPDRYEILEVSADLQERQAQYLRAERTRCSMRFPWNASSVARTGSSSCVSRSKATGFVWPRRQRRKTCCRPCTRLKRIWAGACHPAISPKFLRD